MVKCQPNLQTRNGSAPALNGISAIIPGAMLALALAVIGVGLFAFWIMGETHDPINARDTNWLGKHACPNGQFAYLRGPLQPSSTRPNEEELWRTAVKEQRAWQNRADRQFPDPEYQRERHRNLEIFLANESHYRVEVRRTILEAEAGHPLRVLPICYTEQKQQVLESSGLAIHLGCMTDYPAVQLAHDRGRSDALAWLIEHNIYPVRFIAPIPDSPTASKQ